MSKNKFSKDYFFGKKLSNYANYNDWDNDKYWQSVILVIKKYKISGKMLDIGCAFGFLLKRTQKYFDQIYGFDISDFAIETAKKNVPQGKFKVLNLDEQEIDLPDNYFDLITALDVLEHTQPIKESIEKIVRKIKLGGYLIITLPLLDTWAGKIFHFFDKDPTHVSVPKKKDFLKIIKSFDNFEIVSQKYFFDAKYFKIWGLPVDIELVLKKIKNEK